MKSWRGCATGISPRSALCGQSNDRSHAPSPRPRGGFRAHTHSTTYAVRSIIGAVDDGGDIKLKRLSESDAIALPRAVLFLEDLIEIEQVLQELGSGKVEVETDRYKGSSAQSLAVVEDGRVLHELTVQAGPIRLSFDTHSSYLRVSQMGETPMGPVRQVQNVIERCSPWYRRYFGHFALAAFFVSILLLSRQHFRAGATVASLTYLIAFYVMGVAGTILASP